VAFTGGALLLARQPSPARPRLDIPGVLLVSSGVFCLVYGFANAATHTWHAPSTYGFLVPLLRRGRLGQSRAQSLAPDGVTMATSAGEPGGG
jgi:hypothetical protein